MAVPCANEWPTSAELSIEVGLCTAEIGYKVLQGANAHIAQSGLPTPDVLAYVHTRARLGELQSISAVIAADCWFQALREPAYKVCLGANCAFLVEPLQSYR
jgi:hypothetical protein